MSDITAIDENDPLQAIIAGMDDRRQERLKLRLRVMDQYIPTARDKALVAAMKDLVDTTVTAVGGNHPEGRLLAVTGESGAGKTWTIEQIVPLVPGLKDTLLTITAPRPCTLKQLGRSFLTAFGYEVKRDLPEHLVWEKVRDHLELLKIRFVWIDEFQHSFEGKNDAELLKISDTIKNLMQRRNWPVSFIVSGLPVIANFLGRDRQIERRSSTVPFGGFSFPKHVPLMRQIVERVVVKHAEMTAAAEITTDEFLHRLIHASGQQFGVIIALTRKAVINAFDREDFTGVVTVRDFADAYAAERGCEKSQNVFLAENWTVIQPENSRDREPSDDPAPQADKPSKKKEKK